MDAPTDFVRKLTHEFGGRLRLRWSIARKAWQIEEKVGRAALPPLRVRDIDDSLIRARDGYAFVLEVTPGTRIPCPQCHLELRVPVLQFGEAICSYCQGRKRGGRYRASYFPLGEVLLDHLRKIDPLRGGIEQAVAETDKANERREAAADRHMSNEGEAILKDSINVIGGFTTLGYTGKEQAWVDAPAPRFHSSFQPSGQP